jgi:ATP-dependent Clp endopeptidase proteolytic subunit ClpP
MPRRNLLNSLHAGLMIGCLPILMTSARDSAKATWHARFDNRKKAPKDGGGKLTVKAAGADSTEMMLYDEIGAWGVSAEQFNSALKAVSTPNIVLRINSPGGDVFDGYAMYNALKAHDANVAVIVEGLAASAASFIALAGDTVSMGDPSMMMIHRAFTFAIGNVNDMNAVASVLGKVDGQIADIYAAKSGKSQADMLKLMDAETWLTSQEAADLGLIDEVIDKNTGADDAAAAVLATAHAARARTALLVERGIH